MEFIKAIELFLESNIGSLSTWLSVLVIVLIALFKLYSGIKTTIDNNKSNNEQLNANILLDVKMIADKIENLEAIVDKCITGCTGLVDEAITEVKNEVSKEIVNVNNTLQNVINEITE